MAKITLPSITSGYATTTQLNAALDSIEAEFQDKVLYRDNPTGEPNVMENNLDMNGFAILNRLAVDGDNFLWMGDWTSGTAYLQNNLVYVTSGTYEGYTMIALQDHTAAALFTTDFTVGNWAILARKGDTGASGPGSGDMLTTLNLSDLTDFALARQNLGVEIGVDVLAYDADVAYIDVDQTWSGAQRGTVTTDNDLSFDLAVTNNFKCTPTAGGALTFTNMAAGQSGYILLVNGSNYVITAAATTKVGTAFLATISVTGTYLISYLSDGTNTYCTASGALS